MHVHLDLVGGLAGDMFLAAALDAGLCDCSDIEELLGGLDLGDVRVVSEPVVRGALAGTRLEFEGWDADAESDHRHLSSILDLLERAQIPSNVRTRARQMFRTLGEAEAAIHDLPVEKVHFHECGGLDSIFDFVAGAWAIEELAESWSAGPAPLGTGTVETDHGTMPLPSPATASILEGQRVEQTDVEAERVTPTGATLHRTITRQTPTPDRPSGRVAASGFGAGTRRLEDVANAVRLIAYDESERSDGDRDLPGTTEDVVELTTDVDDLQPEHAADAADRLLAAGALDVVREPILMKKGRRGVRFTVLARPEQRKHLLEALVRHTSTFGVRTRRLERHVLRRRVREVETAFGPVDVKISYLRDRPVQYSPEFDDCRRLAREHDVPVAEVHADAERAARAESDD